MKNRPARLAARHVRQLLQAHHFSAATDADGTSLTRKARETLNRMH